MSVQKEKIKIAVIGCGRFARNFVPLFKAHPSVEKVYVCDLIDERSEEYSKAMRNIRKNGISSILMIYSLSQEIT